MTVLARTIRATPHRASNEAWDVIVALLAPNAGPAREELNRVTGIASALITSEVPKDDPIVVLGAGPRVRIYCVFNEDAVTGDNAREEKLPSPPTDGDWSMSLPCPEEDLTWVKAALANKSTRITARKVGEAVGAQSDRGEEQVVASTAINREVFLRP